MHLGNGAVTAECALIAAGVAAAGVGFAGACANRSPQKQKLAAAGLLAAGVLAAQMVNFPIAPHSSAHLIGGVLLAWTMGPALGALAMAAVLAAQALILGDGGLAALGVNIANMALLPAGLTAVVQRYSSSNASTGAAAIASSATAAAAVMGAAGLIVLETALFRSSAELVGWSAFAANMLSAHVPVCLLEGAATGLMVALIADQKQAGALLRERLRWPTAATAAIAVLALAAPLASSLPDGYESAAERSGQVVWLAGDSATIVSAGQFNASVHEAQHAAVSLFESLLGAETAIILAAAAAAALATIAVSRAAGWIVNQNPAS